MYNPAFRDTDKSAFFSSIRARFGFHLDLAVDDVKRFLETGMRMRARAAPGRDQHIDDAKCATRLFTCDKDAVSIADHRQVFAILWPFRNRSWIAFSILRESLLNVKSRRVDGSKIT